MKTKLMVMVGLVFLAGACTGKKGDAGATGIQGARGPGDIRIFSGDIPSNDFTVRLDAQSNAIKQYSVYIFDGTNWVPLPVFVPATGLNALCVFTPSSGQPQFEFTNCYLQPGLKWQVVLILS